MESPPLPASEPSASAWRHSALSDDIDEHASAQPQWSLRYEQLSAGRFHGEIQIVQLPGVRLVHEHASCATRQRGDIGIGQIGFAMPLALPDQASFNGQPLAPDSIMIGRSEHLDLCSPAGFSLIAITVEASLLGALWERMYHKRLSSWIERQLVVQARPVAAAELRKSHLQALANVAAAPALLNDATAVLQLRDALLMEWIEAIPEQVGTADLGSGEARKRVVDRACELMLAQPEQPLSILQVCSRIGASPRKLEYCFRSVLGISPAKYMRAARLNGARRQLRRERGQGASVQDIAARWGFWHLGEFAAAYKRQFGELPSVTLRGDDGRTPPQA